VEHRIVTIEVVLRRIEKVATEHPVLGLIVMHGPHVKGIPAKSDPDNNQHGIEYPLLRREILLPSLLLRSVFRVSVHAHMYAVKPNYLRIL
jgi:hypothetical protein